MKKVLIAILFVGFANALPAQDTDAQTLDKQFHDIYSDLETYQGYRMFKAYQVENLWNSVKDSIATQRQVIDSTARKIQQLQATISGLHNEVSQARETRDEMKHAGTHIDVFGASFPKPVFLSIVGIVVAGLLVVIFTLSLTNKNSLREKREVGKLYRDLFTEFESYKHNSVEKHIKLSRELQDFRNRYGDKLSEPNDSVPQPDPQFRIGR